MIGFNKKYVISMSGLALNVIEQQKLIFFLLALFYHTHVVNFSIE